MHRRSLASSHRPVTFSCTATVAFSCAVVAFSCSSSRRLQAARAARPRRRGNDSGHSSRSCSATPMTPTTPLHPQPQHHADNADDAAPPAAAAGPRRPRRFSRSHRRAFMDRERWLASMESKNHSKGKKSSEASPGGSHLASVQKPPRQRPKSNPPTSHQESDSENEEFSMPAVSSDSTPSHLSVHSSSQDKEVDGETIDEGNSGSPGSKRKGKRKKGISVSPTNSVARVKRSDCWKLFKVVDVPSKTEKGVTETKAKCRFCYRLFAYKKGGATSTLNRHIKKCTTYLNKLGRHKA
uniref:BED-type domain-containing protein n=1 Tax=Oryza rufipogon TaxID=4529 RepID=A0A0E0MVY1_ORYRU